jgi:hypothetical protein
VSSEDAESLEGLLEATDKATYEAKLQGEGPDLRPLTPKRPRLLLPLGFPVLLGRLQENAQRLTDLGQILRIKGLQKGG